MTESAETRSVLMEKNRMESLTDGIFAFAMTLLVTSMILPGDATATQSSGSALLPCCRNSITTSSHSLSLPRSGWPTMTSSARYTIIDNTFLYMNIIGLFFVTLVPFSTSFIGDYNADIIATCLFEFNLMVLGLVFTLQWYYAARNHRLVSPDYPESAIRRRMNHGLIIPVISLPGSSLP